MPVIGYADSNEDHTSRGPSDSATTGYNKLVPTPGSNATTTALATHGPESTVTAMVEDEGGGDLWLESKRVEIEDRKARVDRICRQHGQEAHWPGGATRALLVDGKHKVGYCRQAKVRQQSFGHLH